MTDPVLPFSHFTDDGVADIDEYDDHTKANRPIQLTGMHRRNGFGCNRLVDRSAWSATFSFTRFRLGIDGAAPGRLAQSQRLVMQSEQTRSAKNVLHEHKKKKAAIEPQCY